MQDEISIIVPIYNSEKTIKKCINSLINQTYKNIKILLINDGSTDNSLEICKKYLKRDNRIILINKENSGVSSARNLGIKKSNSKYITFVDSDDYVDKTICEKLINSIKKNNSKSALCGFYRTFYNENNIKTKRYNILPECKNIVNHIDFKREFSQLYEKALIFVPVCKLYNTNIIKQNHIKFLEKINCGEDLLFNLEYMKYDYKFSIVNECLYYYEYYKSNSLTQIYNKNGYKFRNILFSKSKEFCISENILENTILSINKMYLKGIFIELENLFFKENNLSNLHKKKMFKKIIDNTIKKQRIGLNKKDIESNIYFIILNTKNYFIIKFFVLLRLKIKEKIR